MIIILVQPQNGSSDQSFNKLYSYKVQYVHWIRISKDKYALHSYNNQLK